MPGTPTAVTRVHSGTNSVHCVTGGERDMYVKFLPDAIELAAWETLVRQRCRYLVRVAALVDPETPRTGDTSAGVRLSVGQQRIVRKLRQGDKRYVVTLGPGKGWWRRSMWQFMKDEGDAAKKQVVLADAFAAIAELHCRGVQHNDLHLTNFFVDVWDGGEPAPPHPTRVKLFDFDRSTVIKRTGDEWVYDASGIPTVTPAWDPSSDTWHFVHTIFYHLKKRLPKRVRRLVADAIGHPEFVDRNGPVLGVKRPLGLPGCWSLADGNDCVRGELGRRPTPLHVVFEFDEAPPTSFGFNPCWYEPTMPLDHLGLPGQRHCIGDGDNRVRPGSVFGGLPAATELCRVLRRSVPGARLMLCLCLRRHRIPLEVAQRICQFMG